MTLPPELEKTVRAGMETLSDLAATIVKNPRATIVPVETSPRSGRRALAALRGLKRDPASLQLESVLGEGGMGIVHLARQVALDRRVAVKTLRPQHVSSENVESLLGEAWLAGLLEHPNVVPVYDLGLDKNGVPVLVMKRIEGDAWCDLLADDAVARRHALERDLLEFHVQVLIQVCNAVHFAHSRGVVHRDLKPDNVMIGHFGEVYVVDWGIAAAPGPVRHMAGTPAYMAPEMLGASASDEVTARTDVYLLGAVLYEVLARRTPHAPGDMRAIVSSILLSQPDVPADAPEELADLVRACMSRDPASRPQSALEVRKLLERFVEHRGSMALAAQSEERLRELSELLHAEKKDMMRLYNAYGECRFGFRQALRSWPENARAKEGLREAVSAMLRFEAEQGDARAASLLLADLDEKHPDLEALVEVARRRAEQEQKKIEELRALEKQLDPRTGRQTRLAMGLLLAVLWTVAPLFGPWVVSTHPRYEGIISVPMALLSVLIVVVGTLTRPRSTPLNRQLNRVLIFCMLTQAGGLLAAHWLGLPPHETIFGLLALWFVCMGVVAATVDRRVGIAAGAYLVALGLALRWPEIRYTFVAAANLVVVFTVAFIWSRRGTELEMEAQKRASSAHFARFRL